MVSDRRTGLLRPVETQPGRSRRSRWRSTAGAPSCLPRTTSVIPSARQIVIVIELLNRFWFPPTFPAAYGGRTATALSFDPTEPATVTLLSVNGTRTETPKPTAKLKRLITMPTVSTKKKLAQPNPHPRLRYRVRERTCLVSSLIRDGSCSIYRGRARGFCVRSSLL